MIRFTAVLSANPAPASANTRPRQKLRFGDLAREIARSVLTIVLFDNERGGRWEGGEVPISCCHQDCALSIQSCFIVYCCQIKFVLNVLLMKSFIK